MEIIEQFNNIGNINVKVYKSYNDDYSFYLESSNKDVLHVADIIDETLKNF